MFHAGEFGELPTYICSFALHLAASKLNNHLFAFIIINILLLYSPESTELWK